ncbi:LuxR C-terminal-related transcriptional regulator [Actinoplanes sp. CA-142083]|uniref:helix-turn-helix transcriptional regulator n=1 Tax=Actinoplanes sp. CA-142083 TaxID=3239903 RepID=UPI003D91622B
MTANEALDSGRLAFRRRAWAEAYRDLAAADRQSPLAVDDLELLATAAYLLGRDDVSTGVWERAHHETAARGEHERAARCAFWLAFGLLNRGQYAQTAGWLAKGRRQLGEGESKGESKGEGKREGEGRGDCAERGYLALPDAIQHVEAGDCPRAIAETQAAVELGERCGDPDLVALARCVQGRAHLRQGDTASGMALLDEVMVTVLADEVSPALAGNLYCTVIDGCQEVFDLLRAREWTVALTQWCESQPDLVPYRGQCLVHRAEIMLLRGAWDEAAEAARSAAEHLTRPPHPAAGAALYVVAELHRLRGEFAAAEAAYREANEWGRQPQPGLARLRLSQGRPEAARAAIQRALGELADPAIRPALLAAAVDILLATGEAAGAARAAAELSEVAFRLDMPLLRAMAAGGEGATSHTLTALRRAWQLWHELDAPYEAASVRVLLGLACREAGDEDTARLELDAAAAVFARLGAAPDLAALAELSGRRATGAGGLTPRELEVLRLVAAGKSNRSIAADLFLSERTVARHVSNILAKLGLPSRSAATAYAYERGLV